MEPIDELRKKVKDLDGELVRMLGARMLLTDAIGSEKKKLGMPVYDPKTEKAVIGRARVLAEELNMSPIMVETVIRTVMAESRLRQDVAGQQTVNPDNANIAIARYLPPPMDFKSAIPISTKAAATVDGCRSDIRNILDRRDMRTLLIMGPCSIHDVGQAEEYARRLNKLKKKVDDRFLLVMRTYVEKSRSGIGWTGFLTDPRLDGSGDVQEGITMTRKLLNRLGEMGIPAAVEFINPLSASYIGDLVSWAAIGARSSGTQIHRDMASGLAMPVGFKNGLEGSTDAALGAVESAGQGHDFLGLDETGSIAAFKTQGNQYCHPVLRGGDMPNYDEKSVKKVQKAMKAAKMRPRLMVDCSHGNSGKVADNQADAFRNVVGQITGGNFNIIGLMLESHLNPGKQTLPKELAGFDPSTLQYGVSVTDECLGWDATERLILETYESLP
jgi:3-deoxy-7-phosphoheptulonate synthase